MNIFTPYINDSIIATIFYIVIAIINKTIYDRKNNAYEKNRRLKSYSSFLYIHKFLRLSTLLILLGCIWFNNSNWLILFNNVYTLYIGISVSTLAMVIFLAAGINLGKNYSPCYDSHLPDDIIQDGLYKFIRHPIYTSNLLLMLGVFISCGSALILINFNILFAYYLLSAYLEERQLIKHFPEYKNYKNSTGMFIPLGLQLKKK